jgi:hypothetical protein
MKSTGFDALLDAAAQNDALARAMCEAKDVQALVAIGQREGYAFSADQARATLERAAAAGELGDADLDAVAGGTGALATGQGRTALLLIKLKPVLISSYQTSGAG